MSNFPTDAAGERSDASRPQLPAEIQHLQPVADALLDRMQRGVPGLEQEVRGEGTERTIADASRPQPAAQRAESIEKSVRELEIAAGMRAPAGDVVAPQPQKHYYEGCPALDGTGPCDCQQQYETDKYDAQNPRY